MTDVGSTELLLRPATPSDAQRLFDWRNDPLTCANSLTAPVKWDDHVRWLAASLARADRELWIAEKDGDCVGTVRLDYSDDNCELSWTVAPQWRQRGIGKQIVEMAMLMVRTNIITAGIKLSNEPSRRIAGTLGFIEGQPHDGLSVWNFVKTAS